MQIRLYHILTVLFIIILAPGMMSQTVPPPEIQIISTPAPSNTEILNGTITTSDVDGGSSAPSIPKLVFDRADTSARLEANGTMLRVYSRPDSSSTRCVFFDICTGDDIYGFTMSEKPNPGAEPDYRMTLGTVGAIETRSNWNPPDDSFSCMAIIPDLSSGLPGLTMSSTEDTVFGLKFLMDLGGLAQMEARKPCPKGDSFCDTFGIVTIKPDASEIGGGIAIIDLDNGNDGGEGLRLNLGTKSQLETRDEQAQGYAFARVRIVPDKELETSGLSLIEMKDTAKHKFRIGISDIARIETKRMFATGTGPSADPEMDLIDILFENHDGIGLRLEPVIHTPTAKGMKMDLAGVGRIAACPIWFNGDSCVSIISGGKPDDTGLTIYNDSHSGGFVTRYSDHASISAVPDDSSGCVEIRTSLDTMSPFFKVTEVDTGIAKTMKLEVHGPGAASSTTMGYEYDLLGNRISSTSGTSHTFNGDVHVNGMLSKSAGTFRIDHPLDPENKYLYHSFVESPDMMNIYNGNVLTDQDGYAVVEMPEYFTALNIDFRYQLTVVGQFAQAIVLKEINDNQFTIQTDKPEVKVSWQVTGVRNDQWARENRVQVEVDKNNIENSIK